MSLSRFWGSGSRPNNVTSRALGTVPTRSKWVRRKKSSSEVRGAGCVPDSVRFCRIILSTVAATAAESLRLTLGRGRWAVGFGADESEAQDFSPLVGASLDGGESLDGDALVFWLAPASSLFSGLVGASWAATQVAKQKSRAATPPRPAR